MDDETDPRDAEIRRLKAQNRRLAEELDWREEKIRVLVRIIERTGNAFPRL